MRNSLSFLTMVLVVLLAAGVVAQADRSKTLVGRWDGQRQAEGRVDTVGLVFALTDKGLTGEVLLNNKPFDKMAKITVVNNRVTFSLGDMDFSGAIDGKIMTLTASFEGRDLWTMTVTKGDKAGQSVTSR